LSDAGRTGWGLHVGGVPFRLVRGARRVGAGPGRGGGYSAASLGFSGMSRTASHDAARPARALQLAALVVYVAVVLALTVGKSFYQIGLLWKPENQRVRELLLVPFQLVKESPTLFGVVFDYVGNVAFFVPLGLLLVVVFFGVRRPVWRAVWIAALLSLGIEICPYVFSVGRTSVDDWWCKTLGALLGAFFAVEMGARWHKVWVWLALALGVVFAVLVGLADRLGDPEKVVGLGPSTSKTS